MKMAVFVLVKIIQQGNIVSFPETIACEINI